MTLTASERARLERELLREVMRDINEARGLGYNPKIFLDMIELHKVVGACHRVIMSMPANQMPYGFGRLWELGRLDLTAENTVLRPKWRPLFEDDALLVRAGQRLEWAKGGKLGNFKAGNLEVLEDAATTFHGMTAEAIRADPRWLAEEKAGRIKALDEMTEAEKAAFRDMLDQRFPIAVPMPRAA